LLYLGTHEGAESQPHLDIELHSCEYSTVEDLQQEQKVLERVEVSVQESIISEEDTVTDTVTFQDHSSNENPQNISRDSNRHVGDTAGNVGDVCEIRNTTPDHENIHEYEDMKFIPNELFTVATDTWEELPHQLCRLCASTDEHPKQSIVGWLGMLNEVIPDLVSCLFVLYFFKPLIWYVAM
jgi:hypothetical protein